MLVLGENNGSGPRRQTVHDLLRSGVHFVMHTYHDYDELNICFIELVCLPGHLLLNVTCCDRRSASLGRKMHPFET